MGVYMRSGISGAYLCHNPTSSLVCGVAGQDVLTTLNFCRPSHDINFHWTSIVIWIYGTDEGSYFFPQNVEPIGISQVTDQEFDSPAGNNAAIASHLFDERDSSTNAMPELVEPEVIIVVF